MTEVARLLKASRDAHHVKRQHSGRSDGATVTHQPDYVKTEAAIGEALKARVKAQKLDPQRSDPAWAEDRRLNRGRTSEELVTFFRQYLKIP